MDEKNEMKKTSITLHLYDEDFDVTIKENEKERYIAAAEYVTQKYDSYAQAYQGKKSDHTIALMALLDVALNTIEAAEIEKSLQRPQLTEDEQEYLDAVKEEIVDGVIPDSSRRLLSRLRRSMGISEERAVELEKYVTGA